MSMTIKDLKEIISNLPNETTILIEENDIETTEVHYHSDGRVHLIFSTLE